MALIDREQLVCIGRVTDAHGLAGELKVYAISDDPSWYEDLPALYLDTPHGLRRMAVAEMRSRGRGWILRLEGIAGRTAAEDLRGSDVLVEAGQVKPLAEDEYFTRDLIGCRVVTVAGREVGRVRDVLETAAQPLLQVQGDAGETLVPMVDGIVQAVDVDAQVVTIDPPPGLLPEGAERKAPPGGPKRIDVLTLFPELFGPFLAEGLLGRAVDNGLLAVELVNFRQHGLGRHRQVDDVPYGGGAGMVLRPEPLFAAVRERRRQHAAAGRPTWVVLLTPQGRPFRQADAAALARREEALLLVCGRYEGFDERIRGLADDELSIGDFVCLGGEVPAMAVMEAVVRLLPGVLGNPASSEDESFAAGRLEYPQYTRPPEFEGLAVPEILLSGHHGEIARWREAQARERTARRRPDLLTREAEQDSAARTEPAPARTTRGGARRNRSRRP
jgi:tRNA (guanine37-N1)-methyltransferase